MVQRRRVPRVAPAVLVHVAAAIPTIGVRRALPPALVVTGQAPAAAALGVVELQKFVEPAARCTYMSIRSSSFQTEMTRTNRETNTVKQEARDEKYIT